MTPRGEMGLIIASLGLTSGLISTQSSYSVAVIAVILTTFIAMPILKKCYATFVSLQLLKRKKMNHQQRQIRERNALILKEKIEV